MAKRVALINPNRLQPGVAPIAIDYLAAELERRGFGVDVLDLCNARNPSESIGKFFEEAKPDLIGVSIRNLDDVLFNCFLAGEMKSVVDAVKRASSAPIVLGGSGFSIAPELLLDYYGIDMGIAGEGEEALLMLLDSLDTPDRYPEVPGLVYRKGSEICRNPMGCTDLSSLHLAKRSKIKYSDYTFRKGKRCGVGVQTKRGCSNRCIYCVVPNIEGAAIRLRPPGEIADEMECLATLGVEKIFFADSEFNYPIEHAKGVCEELIARNIREKITWQAYASPGEFDLDLAQKMKEAGCDLVIITIDSGEDALLERWNKPFRTPSIISCVRACLESGLNAVYCLTLGGPGETMETIFKTLQLMQSLKPAKCSFGDPPGLRIYPGTPLEIIVREEGFSPSNPNLRGRIIGNENLLKPVYYMSSGMGILIPIVQLWRKIGYYRHLLLS